ncbi:hypothetical protein [Sphingosinithalassobacter sp. LHW66-3]|uniref:hypothetical protein n=1 Tax=Sphingosinithalassobacter sp. LHW66-3 TaxID=3424718 RepID=UPI003D6B35D5
MNRAAALLLLALPLAACGDGEGNGTAMSIDAISDGGNASITSDADGRFTIKAPGFEGSLKLPPIQIDAADFDVNGMRLYPGSTVTGFNAEADDRMGQRDQAKATFRFTSPADAATVQEWFREQLAANDFEFQADAAGFAGTTAEGDRFRLELGGQGDQTRGTLTIGE